MFTVGCGIFGFVFAAIGIHTDYEQMMYHIQNLEKSVKSTSDNIIEEINKKK